MTDVQILDTVIEIWKQSHPDHGSKPDDCEDCQLLKLMSESEKLRECVVNLGVNTVMLKLLGQDPGPSLVNAVQLGFIVGVKFKALKMAEELFAKK